MLAAAGDAGLQPHIRATVRVLEQAQRRLGHQHTAHRLVDPLDRDLAGAHQVRDVGHVDAALHRHVDAGHQGDTGGIAVVRRVAVGDQLLLGGVVGHHEAGEVPLAVQQVGQQPFVAAGRHAVQVVEGAHDRQRPGVDRRLERRQVDRAQLALAHVGGVVVQSRLGGAVGGEMLGRGQQRGPVGQVVALEALRPRGGEQVVEQHVLAGSLDHPAPALVPADVDHRRIGLVHAGRAPLDRGGPRRAFGQVEVPAGRLAQRHREGRLQSMDDVGGEQQRDAQPALAHGQLLHEPRRLRADAVEQGPDAAGADVSGGLLLVGVERIAGVHAFRAPAERVVLQVQLAGLLLDRHAGDQVVDPGEVVPRLGRRQSRRQHQPRRQRASGEHQSTGRGEGRVAHCNRFHLASDQH